MISLDPRGDASWLAEELGEAFDSPVVFVPEPGTTETFRLADPAMRFWGSSGVRLELATDEAGQPIHYRFMRPTDIGSLVGQPLTDVLDTLEIAVGYEDSDQPFVVSLKRSYAATLVLAGHSLAIQLTPVGRDQLELHGHFPPGNGPSLGDLFLLLGEASGAGKDLRSDLDWLPDELRTGAVVEVTSLHAMAQHKSAGQEERVALPGARPGGVDIQTISVELSFLDGQTWPLIPGHDFLTIGALTARLEVDEPLDPDFRFPRVDVTGEIRIETDAVIELTARWPDYAVSGVLREGEIPLRVLLAELGVPAGKHPASLVIDRLSLQAEPVFEPRSFSLWLEIADVWQVELGAGKLLAIEKVGGAIDYQGGHGGHLTGRLYGRARLGAAALRLSAEASGDGWLFEGSVRLGGDDAPAPTLGSWLGDALERELGLPPARLPEMISAFALERLEVSLHTESTDLSIELACTTALGGSAAQALLTLHYAKLSQGSYELEIEGHLTVGYNDFTLLFDKDGDGQRLVAVYANKNKTRLEIDQLVALGGFEGLPPTGLAVSLTAAELAIAEAGGTRHLLAGLDLGGRLDLTALPLVGSMVGPAEDVSMALQVVYSSAALTDGDADFVQAINDQLPEGAAPLPEAVSIAQGFNLAPLLKIGGERHRLDLPVTIDQQTGAVTETGATPTGQTAAAAESQAGGTSWFPVQEQLGPIHLARIGGRLDKKAGGEQQLTFLLDAGLALGPVEISLDGLGISTPLTRIEPSFSLDGLGLRAAAGPLSIGGAFLHERDPETGIDSYGGAAILGFEELSITAIGSYARVQGEPSLFLYAILDAALGGPAFFFVEGIAAGFGYNRGFAPPLISEVQHFPLIEEARRGGGLPDDVGAELRTLGRFMPIEHDSYFLAAGIKFNSFELIDGVAVLIATFGHHFELDLLGQATLVLPKPEAGKSIEPLIVVDIVLEAMVDPEAGIVQVDAALTDASHVFSEACKLTGGAALYAWLKGDHAGDFVVTLGGYHPAFVPPPHYPRPKRLELDWHVDNHLQIKGDLYCALTPMAAMAGGHLAATYHKGAVRAWFKAGADFLIDWQPYHYDARMYVDVGGSVQVDLLLFTGTVTIDVGADLHVHGPDLAGTATVHLYVTSVDIHFGATPDPPLLLEWPAFVEAFLPQRGQPTIAIADGLVETVKEDGRDIAVIEPRNLRLTIDSPIPLKQYTVDGKSIHTEATRPLLPDGSGKRRKPKTDFSAAPTALRSAQLTTGQTISLYKRKGKTTVGNELVDHVKATPRLKRLPKALWEDRPFIPADFQVRRSKPDLHPDRKPSLPVDPLLDWTVCSFDIVAKAPRKPGKTHEVERERLLSTHASRSGTWAEPAIRVAQELSAIDRREIIAADLLDDTASAHRARLMKAAGLDPSGVTLRGDLFALFREAPVVDAPIGLGP